MCKISPECIYLRSGFTIKKIPLDKNDKIC